jgi:putative spermidine/putrescine transport system ATP-binding protein
VYVTHDQAEAMALGDRIAVMSHGRIAQIGTPHEIYFSPADAFVADFIGAMNRLEGQAEDGRVRFAGGWLPLPLGAGGSTVMFRPEDLRLVDPDQAQFSGQVISSFFLGDHTRLVIDAQGVQLVARVQDRRVFRPGDAVHGCVDAPAVMALPSALT